MLHSFAVEALETRALLSNVSLVKDINSVDLYPSSLTPAGTNLFYTVANSGNTAALLAVTTAAGGSTTLAATNLVNPTDLVPVGNSVDFLVSESGSETLWTSNGTLQGTQAISFSDPKDPGSTYLSDLTDVAGTLFFFSSDPNSTTYGADLWSLTPGSTTPTLVAADITASSEPGTAANLTAVGSVAYFTVTTSGTNPVSGELWQSNGTPGQAAPVTYVDSSTHQTTDITQVQQIVNFNGTLDYVALDPNSQNADLDTYNLTTTPQTVHSFPTAQLLSNVLVVGTGLYYDETDATGDRQLWVTTSNSATTELTSIENDAQGSYPSNLTDVAGTVYFTATGANNQNQLWKTSGTVQGTSLVTDLTEPPGSHPYAYYQVYGYGPAGSATGMATALGTLFFANGDPTHGTELWSTSASLAPALLDDIDPGAASSAPHDFVLFNSEVYFAAHDGSSPQVSQLWATNGTSTASVASFSPAYTAGSLVNGDSVATLGNTLIFIANDGVNGPAVWASDGTSGGTVLLADVDPGNFVTFTDSQGTELVYFVGSSPQGPALWETNGTVAGTSIVQSLPSQPATSYTYGPTDYDLTAAGGKLFFLSSDGKGGQDLWLSDGTAAGTSVVKDIVQTSTYDGTTSYYSLSVGDLTAAGGKLFFSAQDPNGGIDLWVSNGTASGTTVLNDLPGSAGAQYYPGVSNLTAAAGELFFTGDNGTDGPQPWVSNGTSSGTFMLADVNPGAAGSAPGSFTQIGSNVYFFMNESATTVGLWQTNGTVAGTTKVTDAFPSLTVNSSTYAPSLGNVTAIGSQLFFALEYNVSPTPQFELWASDGTTRGTHEVVPSSLPSGATFSEMQNFGALGNALVFTANDGNGAELWTSDGTASGTTVIDDNGPTVVDSYYNGYSEPYEALDAESGILYFAGNDAASGTQLWRTDGTQNGTLMVSDFSGSSSAALVPLAVVNNQLLFYGDDGVHGEELWSAAIPPGPTITPIPAQTAVVNQQLTVDVQASENGNPSAVLAYALIQGPPQGASISATGVFTWTPTTAQTPGDYEITVKVTDTSDLGTPSSTTSFAVTVTDAPASQVVITSPALDLTADTTGEITVELADQYGDLGAVSASNQTIALSTTSAGGVFYATATSTSPITSLVIPAGQSTANVYYLDTRAGTPTVTLADAALDSAPTQQETINAGAPSQLAITTSPLDLIVGTLGQLTLELEDKTGNPTTSASRPDDRSDFQQLGRSVLRNRCGDHADHQRCAARWPDKRERLLCRHNARRTDLDCRR